MRTVTVQLTFNFISITNGIGKWVNLDINFITVTLMPKAYLKHIGIVLQRFSLSVQWTSQRNL